MSAKRPKTAEPTNAECMAACSLCFENGFTAPATKVVPQETFYSESGERVDSLAHPITWRQVCDGCADGWFDGANKELTRLTFDLPKED